jgi:hypothetical protein
VHRLSKITSLLCSVAFILTASLTASTFAMADPVDDFTAPTKAQIQQKVSEINAAIKATGGKWVAGETSISVLSPAERRMRLGAAPLPEPEPGQAAQAPETEKPLPSFVTLSAPYGVLDWRNYNGASAIAGLRSGSYVTPIRNQGNCGACWAFGSIAGLESATLLKMNIPGANLNLSEQVVLSCSGGGSCESGGYIVTSFFQNTGVPFEYCYPYGGTDGSCGYACSNYWAGTDNYKGTYQSIVSWGAAPTVDTLKNALYNYGPIVVRMEVYSGLYYYKSNVYSSWGNDEGGHIVLLVGYDDYNQCFIVKNSWGTGWGERGFFKIAYSEVGTYWTGGASQFGSVAGCYTALPPTLSSTISYPAPNSVLSKVDLGSSTCVIRGAANTNSVKYLGVYVVTNGGNIWYRAKDTSGNGTWSSWTYNWPLPRVDGTYIIDCLVTDGYVQTVTNNPITVMVDNTRPTSVTTSPLKGSALNGASYLITGTATDNLSGVTGIEVSTDGGKTWNTAAITSGSGTTSATWSYNWTMGDGAYVIKSRATDLAQNVEKPLAAAAVAVTVPSVVTLNPITPNGNSVTATASVVDTAGTPVSGAAVLFYCAKQGTSTWVHKSTVLTGADGTCTSLPFTLHSGSYQVKAVNKFAANKLATSNIVVPVVIDAITSAK